MSMEKLTPGQRSELETEVTEALTINRMGRPGAAVLSTSSLLGLMEQCSIDASDPYLPDGYTSVGYAVDGLRHLAPTPIGKKVKVTAVLRDVDRNRLTFDIEAFEGEKKIGVATHRRAVISKENGG